MGDEGFYLEDHHEMIREMVREFAEAEIAPVAARYDESEEFPWDTAPSWRNWDCSGFPSRKDWAAPAWTSSPRRSPWEELARVTRAIRS